MSRGRDDDRDNPGAGQNPPDDGNENISEGRMPRRGPSGARREDDYDDPDVGRSNRDDDDEGMTEGRLQRRARDQVNVPSILLIIGAVLNILSGGYLAVNGIFAMTVGKEQVKAQMDQQLKADPKQAKEMEKLPFSMEGLIAGIGGGYIAIGILGVLTGIIAIIGGVQMRSLKGRGLAIFGSVLSMIPCVVSPCCLAWGAGLWALIVLMNSDVKAAFR